MMLRLANLCALLLIGTAVGANDFHPTFPLLDKDGRPVIESGSPLSTQASCGACHDTVFIAESSDHANITAGQSDGSPNTPAGLSGRGDFWDWNPLNYSNAVDADSAADTTAWLRDFGARHVGGGPVADDVEMDCLLCHGDITDNGPRRQALERGDLQWANSVVLSRRGILRWENERWTWVADKFRVDGSLQAGLLNIRKPRDANCAGCHGQVDNSLEIPLTIDPDRSHRTMTERTGEIISPQKLSNSGLNLVNKESLTHAFDIHSDRVVACVNCHYSLNNPVYFQQRPESRPVHLDFDPRRLTSAEYLERPLHQFAKGNSTYGLAAPESENSLRRCSSCHEPENVHEWLPYRRRHFTALACESCHIPRVYGPALQSIDWTLVDSRGQPRVQYRGVEGDPAMADSLVRGFRPLLLPRENRDGMTRLAPFNLVTSWFWVSGDPARPVSRQSLVSALYPGKEPHPDLLEALDDDGDGLLAAREMRLSDSERAAAVSRRLEESGFQDVRLAGEIMPFTINHGVVNGRWATRECSVCHSDSSALAAAFPLSGYLPQGSGSQESLAGQKALPGTFNLLENGSLEFTADSGEAGFYILGLSDVSWVDSLGLLMLLGVSLSVTVHALARYFINRRRARNHQATHPVYMYDRYERLWHWLQASAILILLATGLVIHKPHLFGMFSFAYIVQVHNVLGFILLTNAALALFYNLASGEIRQYLPRPRGFIGRSVAQAMYYSRGIFAGEPHPLEKTKEQKLNPLQQITYLAILNLLLPAQVITGVLIWGLQKWPQLAASLGGLPILAPIHTLVAWAFSAFIVMHVYLTTAAGETPGAGIRSMVTGWEDVEKRSSEDSMETAQ